MQQLQQELETIAQQFSAIEANIQPEQQKVDGLNNRLQQQQEELDVLNNELNNLHEQASLLEQQLIDKYHEIEITNNYLSQVEGEINRLDSRLELLKQAGIYEQQYQENWQQWQTANQARTSATEALIAIRQAGASDRSTLASLQSQLTQTQANLNEAKIIQESLSDTQKALALSRLQLGNQHLLLRSLVDRDTPLAATQQYYANLAEQSRQRIWANNRYNPGEASAYRTYLQQASFIADQRNQAWQQRQQAQTRIGELHQKIGQQQAEISSQQQQLANLGGIAQLEAQVANINSQINTVNQRLQPLQIQENQHTQAIAAADAQMQNLATELVQTAQLQGDVLRQLVGFGILASESDVDFFITQVEPNVNSSIQQLRERDTELTAQVENAKIRTANAEQQLANSTDETSKQALTNLIEQLQQQQTNLEELTAQNQQAADELEDLLNQANAALTPLRQKQEVEIRQKLNSNYKRLQALESQLNSENAAETARETDTVQNYVQLTDQIRQDLTDNATNWTEQLLASHQLTKELGNSQENLSQSIDELIDYITGNLADPDGEYNSSEANLRDGITTLGVVESRADELDSSVTSVNDAIEKLKLRIEQDAKLWEEIAPIAIRYGVESEQLAEFTQLTQKLQTAKEKFDQQQPEAIAFATQEILPIARSFLDKARTNPQLTNLVEKVKQLVENFDDLASKQTASEVKAAEVRQEWKNNHNDDDTPITRINFGDKLVESRLGQDNLVYVRNSIDGSKTWTQWLHTGGRSNFKNIKMAVVDNKLFQSLRANDNQIWGRSSTDGVNWGGWFPIGGSMTTDYSMDVIDNNLVFSVRNSDNKIYSRTAVNGTQWNNWESIDSTMSDISQDVVDGKLIQSYRGFDDRVYVRQSADGINWENWEDIDSATAKPEYLQQLQKSDTHKLNPVSKIQYKDKLIETVRGEDTRVYGRYSTDGGKTWSNWQYQNHGGASTDVQMVVADNTLIQAARGNDNILYVRQSSDGLNWTPWANIASAIAEDFAMDVVDNKVVFSIRSASNQNFYSRTLIPNVRWTNWEAAQVATINHIDQKVVDGKVVQSYKGVDERIYVRYSTDGLNWQPWETLEEAIAQPEINQQYLAELQKSSDRTPNPVTQTQYKDKLIETVRGEDTRVYGRYSTDGGKTWSNWQYQNHGGASTDVQMVVADNTLIQAARGNDNILYVRQSNDGLNWTPWANIASAISEDFDVDVIDDKVVFSVRTSNNKFNTRTLIPNVRWTNLEPAPVNTLDGVSQKIVDGKVVQSYQGIDGQIYIRSTTDGINWTPWENHEAIAQQYQQQKEALLQPITQETSLAARPLFLAENSENGTAIDSLQAATLEGRSPTQEVTNLLNATNPDFILNADAVEGRNPLQALYDKAKAEESSHNSQGHALLGQAAWHEQQAAYHWARSRKNGPYWYEQRWVKKRSGGGYVETITHIDHHWIAWQNHSQTFPQLRQQGTANLAEADKWRKVKERLEPLKNQWVEANDAANEAHPAVKEARNLFAELEAARSDIPQAQTQLEIAVEARQERDRLELERKRLETQARIEHLQQLQAEDDLRQSLNQVRASVGLDDLEATENQAQLQTQLAGLLTNLENLETNQPDLPDDIKALLAEARGDIHLALQGKEAEKIQENLLTAMDGLIGQIEQYKTEINSIDLEEQLDTQLLQKAESDLQGASQELLDELKRSGELSEERDVIDPLHLKVLTDVALAEDAVGISEDLARQSRGILDQIIKQRIAQRKARKKAFWNKVLGIVSTVLSLVGTVLTFVPGANLVGLALGAVSGGISAIQAAVNGDWMGAIFSGVMTGLTAITGGMTHALGESARAVQTMKTIQTVAAGAYSGARSAMSGDSIMSFLQILGSVASAAAGTMNNVIGQLSDSAQKVMRSVVQSLQQAPQLIYGGVKAIQSGDWIDAIGQMFNAAMAIGQSFAGNFNTAVAGILEKVGNAGNTALYLGKAIKDGGIEAWLSGVEGILKIWKDDIKGLVDKISGKEECVCVETPLESEESSISEQDKEEFLNDLETQEIWKALEQELGLEPGLIREKFMSMSLEEFSALVTEVKNQPLTTDDILALANYNDTPNTNSNQPVVLKGHIYSSNGEYQISDSYYAIEVGDTLWDIAEKQLGDGSRWRELRKVDGTTFTEEEARNLQVGENIYLPATVKSQPQILSDSSTVELKTKTTSDSSTSKDLFDSAASNVIGELSTNLINRINSKINKPSSPIVKPAATPKVTDAPPGTTRTSGGVLVPDAPPGTTRTSGGVLVPDAPPGTTRTSGGVLVPDTNPKIGKPSSNILVRASGAVKNGVGGTLISEAVSPLITALTQTWLEKTWLEKTGIIKDDGKSIGQAIADNYKELSNKLKDPDYLLRNVAPKAGVAALTALALGSNPGGWAVAAGIGINTLWGLHLDRQYEKNKSKAK